MSSVANEVMEEKGEKEHEYDGAVPHQQFHQYQVYKLLPISFIQMSPFPVSFS